MVVLNIDHMSLLEWSSTQNSATLRARLATLPQTEVVTTIISYEEQVRGWMAYIARLRTAGVTQQVEACTRRLHRQLDNYCRIPGLTFDALAAVTFCSSYVVPVFRDWDDGLEDRGYCALACGNPSLSQPRRLRSGSGFTG